MAAFSYVILIALLVRILQGRTPFVCLEKRSLLFTAKETFVTDGDFVRKFLSFVPVVQRESASRLPGDQGEGVLCNRMSRAKLLWCKTFSRTDDWPTKGKNAANVYFMLMGLEDLQLCYFQRSALLFRVSQASCCSHSPYICICMTATTPIFSYCSCGFSSCNHSASLARS